MPNAPQIAVARDEAGRLLPGTVLNPGGRPRDRYLREALEPHCDATIERLISLIHSDDEQVALGAVKEFFNRRYGKAVEAHLLIQDKAPIEFEQLVRNLSNEQLARIESIMREK